MTLAAYDHDQHDQHDDAPDPRPGHYYVSVIDPDTGRAFIAAGPWPDHADALAHVQPVRRCAVELAERATERSRRLTTWGAFGTCRLAPEADAPTGPMNDLLPAALRPPPRP